MKPVFNEEIVFFEKYTGIRLPDNCWRDGGSFYLNNRDEFPILKFKVENEEIIITKNNIEWIEGDKVKVKLKYKGKKIDKVIKNKTWEQEVKEESKILEHLVRKSVKQTAMFLYDNPTPQIRVSISGGKDSSVMNYIFRKYVEPTLRDRDIVYEAFNTTNDTADTYKQMYKEGVPKENVHTPIVRYKNEEGKFEEKAMGWYQWIKDVKHYWIPTVLKRSCCSTFKEGQAKRVQDKNKDYITLVGVRKYESTKRAHYEFNIKESTIKAGKEYNMPMNWDRIAPICYWKTSQVWLYILQEGIEFNPMYKKGFSRCGCLICPYGSPYTNLLIKEYYPKQWERWMGILAKNYEVKDVGKRLKWSLEEYQKGEWTVGLSKEHKLISLKKTPERVQQLADIKECSYEVAEKYWDNKCKCGKKLNPDEVAMFLKIMGRYEGMEDNRQYMCKECLCKAMGWTTKQYAEKVKEFRDSGCKLF